VRDLPGEVPAALFVVIQPPAAQFPSMPRALPPAAVDHVASLDDMSQMPRMILEEEGYAVSEVSSANIAFGILKGPDRSTEQSSDLVLLDLTMPGMDPLEMVRKVGTQDMPPVIVLSAKPAALVAEAARSIDAAAVVHKPFGIDDLLETVRRVLHLATAQAHPR
jgi:DNA-binding response OmpR family regulator